MKATIIGAGNLGAAIALGFARGTFLKAPDITCVDPDMRALARLKSTGMGFRLTSDLRKGIEGADILVLAVKPDVALEVIEKGRPYFKYDHQIFCSAVGGMSFAELDEAMFAGMDYPEGKLPTPVHFRVMTNLAIAMGEGMIFLASRNANAAQVKLSEALFGEMGQTMVVPEKMLEAAMAVSSCGIAYAMRYVRAAMSGAIEAGFRSDDALAIVLQTIRGAIMLLENGEHPEVEIDKVATRGGFTIRGLNAMEERGFSASVIAGIQASRHNF